jgi:hypothetical protein
MHSRLMQGTTSRDHTLRKRGNERLLQRAGAAARISPLAPVLGGEGLGVRGWNHAATMPLLGISLTPPHPPPLSPEYGGEGRKMLGIVFSGPCLQTRRIG